MILPNSIEKLDELQIKLENERKSLVERLNEIRKKKAQLERRNRINTLIKLGELLENYTGENGHTIEEIKMILDSHLEKNDNSTEEIVYEEESDYEEDEPFTNENGYINSDDNKDYIY